MEYSLNSVIIPLTIERSGKKLVPSSSGLNWGQRVGRNEDQAYLPVSAEIQRSKFFPPKGKTFVLKWDDGEEFLCVRAQQNGKAIHTPSDNSLLGRYFRKRLGVNFGDAIVMPHLTRYGRFDVEILKKGNDFFYADFASPLT